MFIVFMCLFSVCVSVFSHCICGKSLFSGDSHITDSSVRHLGVERLLSSVKYHKIYSFERTGYYFIENLNTSINIQTYRQVEAHVIFINKLSEHVRTNCTT